LQLAQLPPLQNGWLPWHELQAPPPAPQYVVVLPVSHWLPLQQPLHDVLSHSHTPPEQCCPVAHGDPVPHMQAPVVAEQLSDVAPHDAHVRPWSPHSAPVGGDTQVVPLQHPLGHVWALQTHEPDWHTCPAPHSADEPHRHAPDVEQLFESDDGHVTHVAPSVPHAVTDGVSHVAPLQHPLGHDVELHVHMPAEQTCPVEHSTPLPHWQPSGPQAFAFVMSHAEHASPCVPHVASDDVSHTAPAQHPLGQFCGVHPVHTCDVHVCGDGHDEHIEPCVPQYVVVVPGSQTVPLQHPVGHEVELQAQIPPEHTWPLPHAAAPPHVHVPSALHPSAVAPHAVQAPPWSPQAAAVCASQTPLLQQPLGQDVLSQTHAWLEQRWPTPHAAPDPHSQEPLALHPSDFVMSHATQLAPPVPHADCDNDVSQVDPLQHPVGHDVALQTQTLAEHVCPVLHAGLLPHLQ
jgi:hypothetical protein